MGNIISNELRRDMVHLRDHDDFKRALGATGELLEAYARAEQLRVQRKEQKMKEHRQSRQSEEAGQQRQPIPSNRYELPRPIPMTPNRRKAGGRRPREQNHWRETEPGMGRFPNDHADLGLDQAEIDPTFRPTPRSPGLRYSPHRGPPPGPQDFSEAYNPGMPFAGPRRASNARYRRPAYYGASDADMHDMYDQGLPAHKVRSPRAQRPGRRQHTPSMSSIGIGSFDGSQLGRSPASGSRSGKSQHMGSPPPGDGGPGFRESPRMARREGPVPE